MDPSICRECDAVYAFGYCQDCGDEFCSSCYFRTHPKLLASHRFHLISQPPGYDVDRPISNAYVPIVLDSPAVPPNMRIPVMELSSFPAPSRNEIVKPLQMEIQNIIDTTRVEFNTESNFDTSIRVALHKSETEQDIQEVVPVNSSVDSKILANSFHSVVDKATTRKMIEKQRQLLGLKPHHSGSDTDSDSDGGSNISKVGLSSVGRHIRRASVTGSLPIGLQVEARLLSDAAARELVAQTAHESDDQVY